MTNAEKSRLLKESQKQLNAKLRFERKFSNELRRFIAQQNEQVIEHILNFRNAPDSNLNREAFAALLLLHYNRVIKRFQGGVFREANAALKPLGIDKVVATDPAIAAAISAFIAQSAQEGAERFAQRSNRDVLVAMRRSDTVDEVKEILDGVVNRRAQALSAEHTQRAAEGGKAELSRAIQENTAGSLFVAGATLQRYKIWMTRQDNRVRDAHAMALFQRVLASLPFSIDGEQLMFPGDTSLGASIRNVANCRCSAIYSFGVR